MPDLELITKGQCFPRYRYETETAQENLPDRVHRTGRIDNITDTALDAFRKRYGDHTISKDDLFDYVYGLLHAPEYGQRFANDLSKELPRIPFAPDFHAFAEAGKELAELHLGYERCAQYPLTLEYSGQGEPLPEHFRIGERSMQWMEDRSILKVNELLRLSGIPPQAHEYQVNGRTPLEWFVDRYHITRDKKSGIVNDPNGWFRDPRDLITAIRRIVHVSVQTKRIVDDLPEPFPARRRADALVPPTPPL